MSLFRFTMNVHVEGLPADSFDATAGMVLDEVLRRVAAGKAQRGRVLGRPTQEFLKVIFEFESTSHNSAHSYGFDLVADVFQTLGADVSGWFDEPHRAVIEDDGTDRWDVLVELLKHARVEVTESRTEPIAA